MTKAIYIAGPDVFFPNASEHFARIIAKLADHGLRALVPSDGELSAHAMPGPEVAARIFEENVHLIEQADALLVNLNAFRGTEPDSGTCFEVGLAYGLRKPIVAYLDQAELYVDRVTRLCGTRRDEQRKAHFDLKTGCLVEEMGLPVNLMLACSCHLETAGLDAAVARLARLLTQAPV